MCTSEFPKRQISMKKWKEVLWSETRYCLARTLTKVNIQGKLKVSVVSRCLREDVGVGVRWSGH